MKTYAIELQLSQEDLGMLLLELEHDVRSCEIVAESKQEHGDPETATAYRKLAKLYDQLHTKLYERWQQDSAKRIQPRLPFGGVQ